MQECDEKLYFICETKGSTDTEQLRVTEGDKSTAAKSTSKRLESSIVWPRPYPKH